MFRKGVRNNKDGMRRGWSLVAASLSAGLAIGLGLIGLWSSSPTVRFTLIGLAGAIGVISALALISIALTNLGLYAKGEPLGLPAGSIQAIIAVGLIVFFVIGMIYYFENITHPDPYEIHGITQEQLGNITGNQIMASFPDANGTYTVVLQLVPSQNSIDFAKQVLTTLSTLVVAVSAFYFGSRTAAAKTVTPLTSISVTSDSSGPLEVGSKRQFSATGTYGDGSTSDITSQVTWTSSDTTKATITSPGGLATGVAAGNTKITASIAGVSGTADLQVM